MLLCTIPWTTVCTSLLFTLLFIKSQYTVFLFCTSYCFLHILLLLFFLHILFAHPIVFCTSYCFFAHLIVLHFFYFIAHFTLISPFLTTCMPLCYVTLYNLYSYYFALSTERTWFDYISLLIIPCITIMWQIKKPWPWPWKDICPKYLHLDSEAEQRSCGFGTTWGCVINDWIFIFGWTILLMGFMGLDWNRWWLNNNNFHFWVN